MAKEFAVREHIGYEIYRKRKAIKMSSSTLASRTGVHRNTITRAERGEHCLTLDILYRIAKVLGLSLDFLLTLDVAQRKPVQSVQPFKVRLNGTNRL